MHDILFNIPVGGGRYLPIHSYGVMAMLGFIVALAVARWRSKKAGINPETTMDVAVWALVAGIIGSRLAYVITNAGFYFDTSRPDWSFWDLLKIWEGGLVFYGGFIGAMIATLVVCRVRRQKLLPMLDVLAPSLALGHAFGRVGCFLRGCCYGRPVAEGAWYGVKFPPDSAPYDPHALHPIAPGTTLFPSQIMSSIDLLIIFGILMWYFPRRKGIGEVTGLYLILYSTQRFIVEFLRGDTHLPGQLSPAQWISIVAFFGGLCLLVYARSRAARVNLNGSSTAKNSKNAKNGCHS